MHNSHHQTGRRTINHVKAHAPQHSLLTKYVQQEADSSFRYEAFLQPAKSGSIAYVVRVLPSHPALAGKHDMGLIRWG
jgi:starch phosphorylase